MPPVWITPEPFADVAVAAGWLGASVPVLPLYSCTMCCWYRGSEAAPTPMWYELLCQITSFSRFGTERVRQFPLVAEAPV